MNGASGTPPTPRTLVVGAARFESGALANLLLSHAGRGEGHFRRTLYGTAGTLDIPPDRTGSPLKVVLRRDGQDVEVPAADLLDLVPDFTLDRTTADLFGGVRLPSYDLPWADIDANLLAVEFDDFAGAILDDRPARGVGTRRPAVSHRDARLLRVAESRAGRGRGGFPPIRKGLKHSLTRAPEGAQAPG